jgi:hypothetical protein
LLSIYNHGDSAAAAGSDASATTIVTGTTVTSVLWIN